MDLKDIFPLTIGEEHSGRRFDQVLVELFPDVSRSRWSQLIEQGLFLIQGKVLKASHKTKNGEVISLDPKLSPLTSKEDEPSVKLEYKGPEPEVIFEDETVVVVNKPVGLAVHPGSGLALEQTLSAWLQVTGRVKSGAGLLEFDDEILEEQRPGIVHRLDKGTSGLIIMAKDPATHTALAEQFQTRKAGRIYWAIVRGNPLELKEKRPARVNSLLERAPSPIALRFREDNLMSFGAYLDRDPRERVRFRVSSEGQGKKSLTHFQVLSSAGSFSALALKLATGRTHQIRVHLSFLGFPILGDTLYSGSEHCRMMLHAHRLRFWHPQLKKTFEFQVPWSTQDQAEIANLGLQFGKEELPWLD